MEQFYELVQHEYNQLGVVLPDGQIAKKTGWHQLKTGKWSYVDNKKLAIGWKVIGGKSYYFDTKGIMQNGWIQEAKKWYYLLDNGVRATDWQNIGGIWHYFNQWGVMHQGWVDKNNEKYYLLTSGAIVTGWKIINKSWYYFNETGLMHQGWMHQNGKWYYLLKSGEMVTGWQSIDGYWHYFEQPGVMQQGWSKQGNEWYYFNQSGVMQQGWQKQNGIWYYLMSGGAMSDGWHFIGNSWYYFEVTGVMKTKDWVYDHSKLYYVSSSGAMIKDWVSVSSHGYYFDKNGLNIDNNQTKFISQNINDVLVITQKRSLYPSIMLSQAILESGYGSSELAENANNFFGMKFKVNEDEGKYGIYYVDTKEYDKDKDETIIVRAPFRKYENKLSSFEDNAFKLRNGVSWDTNYYKGAWWENEKDYKEVSKALTGKYATDKEYNKKLNAVVERWNLNQFD